MTYNFSSIFGTYTKMWEKISHTNGRDKHTKQFYMQ